MRKDPRQYEKANQQWLQARAGDPGVHTLDKGVMYKVLASGPADTVVGRGAWGTALAIRLCNLIEGWIIAMQAMHVGDKWEVYIPASMGYGRYAQPGIPAYSTLIFEIELLGVQ